MSAVKCKHEYKTLLDFSKTERRVSKNLVKQMLRQAELPSYRNSGNEIIYTNYEINVGMYHIHLLLNADEFVAQTKLKDYGSFSFELTEEILGQPKNEYDMRNVIWVERDSRFKHQYWSDRNKSIRINDLVNMIIHCKRLSNLKAFL